MKLWNSAGRGQSVASLRLLPHHSTFSPSTHPHQPAPSAPQLALRHGPEEQYSPAILAPAVLLLPFFFIKLPKQQNVAPVAWRGIQLAGPAVAGAQLARRPMPSRWPACLPPSSLSPASRCGLSAAGGAIGKQRPKMRSPVSSSLLMNK